MSTENEHWAQQTKNRETNITDIIGIAAILSWKYRHIYYIIDLKSWYQPITRRHRPPCTCSAKWHMKCFTERRRTLSVRQCGYKIWRANYTHNIFICLCSHGLVVVERLLLSQQMSQTLVSSNSW